MSWNLASLRPCEYHTASLVNVASRHALDPVPRPEQVPKCVRETDLLRDKGRPEQNGFMSGYCAMLVANTGHVVFR